LLQTIIEQILLSNGLVLGGQVNEVIANSGAISSQNQTIISSKDAKTILEASKDAKIYARRFENFPKITYYRFFMWDIALPSILTFAAVFMAAKSLW